MIQIPAEVKEALRAGTYKKEYFITVYKEDETTVDFIITNDTLVAESVQFNEHMVSTQKLKFGLCEGTSLEFQYFNHSNITGRRIKVELGAYTPTYSTTPYKIPMGWFTAKSCARNSKSGIIKATCYNKLMSDYLDAKANELIKANAAGGSATMCVCDILSNLLGDFSIKEEQRQSVPISTKSYYGSYAWTNVSTYKYTNLYGNQGPFSPQILLDEGITTSTTIYLTGKIVPYSFTVPTGQSNIKIKLTKDFTAIENNIYNAVGAAITRASTTTTSAAVQTAMAKTTIYEDTSPASYAAGPIMSVKIVYKSGAVETYSTRGKAAGSATGTFEDLQKRTFIDVSKVVFLQPEHIKFYKDKDGEIYSDDGCNYIRLYGDKWNYSYSTTASNFFVAQYEAPKMPDGSIIEQPWPAGWGHDTSISLAQYIQVDSITNLSPIEKIKINTSTMPDVTLRDMQSAVFEQLAQFGKLDRTTDLFSGIYLNNDRLLPGEDEDHRPSENLYPKSTAENSNPAIYTDLYADEGDVHNFKYLIITYRGTDDQEHTLQRTVNTNGTDNYNMSSNWLFKNLQWTADQVGQYADQMVQLIKDVQWFPFEMDCCGLPYVEAGDEIEITINNETHTTYVLQRLLQGIQRLTDTYYNGTVNTF